MLSCTDSIQGKTLLKLLLVFLSMLSIASVEEMQFGSIIHCVPSQSTSSIFSM